jgi:UDP-N-acetylmuramate dehydrogenase
MERLLAAINEEFRGEVRRDELMLSHTSWRIGGPAQLFVIPEDSRDLRTLLAVLKRFNAPWIILGNGTNLLVKDDGIAGAVISLERFDSIEMKILNRVQVGAGISLSKLIQHCVANGLQGLEGLTGIPGTVGGALLMNAGVGEMEIGSLVESLTLVDAEEEKVVEGADLEFRYRNSGLAGQGVITSTCLRLKPSNIDELIEICREKQEQRCQTQSLAGAHAGSVFKNPEGKKAWKLIDAAGLRGERCGDAEISTVHCNHIVNLGHATATDVLSLIEMAQQKVFEKSGIDLEMEIHVAGREVAL